MYSVLYMPYMNDVKHGRGLLVRRRWGVIGDGGRWRRLVGGGANVSKFTAHACENAPVNHF